jgi:hypothetical protein
MNPMKAIALFHKTVPFFGKVAALALLAINFQPCISQSTRPMA